MFYKNDVAHADYELVCSLGTTWLTQVMFQIAWRGEGHYPHINDVVPWPEGQRMHPGMVTLEEQHTLPQHRSPTVKLPHLACEVIEPNHFRIRRSIISHQTQP